MSQVPGYVSADATDGPADNAFREQENEKNKPGAFVPMKGSTAMNIPNPTGAKLVDTQPSPPNPWEKKAPFENNKDSSHPTNGVNQPQAGEHQNIREGPEAVKEPTDGIDEQHSSNLSPQQQQTPNPSHATETHERGAVKELTGGQPLSEGNEGNRPRPYSKEERAGQLLDESDRDSRQQPQHQEQPDPLYGGGLQQPQQYQQPQEYQQQQPLNGRDQEQQHHYQQQHQQHHQQQNQYEQQPQQQHQQQPQYLNEQERQREERERELLEQKQREHGRPLENRHEQDLRGRQREQEQQRARDIEHEQRKREQVAREKPHEWNQGGAGGKQHPEATRDVKQDRGHRTTNDRDGHGPTGGFQGGQQQLHQQQQQHYQQPHQQPQQPTGHQGQTQAPKKSKAGGTMNKAVGSIKEKVGKLVHNEKLIEQGVEQKTVGDTQRKLVALDHS